MARSPELLNIDLEVRSRGVEGGMPLDQPAGSGVVPPMTVSKLACFLLVLQLAPSFSSAQDPSLAITEVLGTYQLEDAPGQVAIVLRADGRFEYRTHSCLGAPCSRRGGGA